MFSQTIKYKKKNINLFSKLFLIWKYISNSVQISVFSTKQKKNEHD